MVRAGCVFVAGIHPSRTWTSGSFGSVRRNACMHRLDLGLYSHPKEFWGNGVWTHVNSKGKIPSTGWCPQRSIEPATLWQRAQALPTELFRSWKRKMKQEKMENRKQIGGERIGPKIMEKTKYNGKSASLWLVIGRLCTYWTVLFWDAVVYSLWATPPIKRTVILPSDAILNNNQHNLYVQLGA